MYFTESEIKFFDSGSTLLNCVLAGGVKDGGWARGRVLNVVGDKSSGKTLLALEAIANNLIESPKSANHYSDVESSFALEYAKELGIPLEKINFEEEMYTVEDFYSRLETMEENVEEKDNGLFILDSLDGLSDEAELAREITDKTFGGNKARQMSQLFRRINAKISHKNITLMVISQVRDMLNTSIPMKTRSGGRALDFYASQILWLAEKSKIKRTIQGQEKIVGIEVHAKCKKNKVAMPFRECDFRLMFSYGMDNVWSNLEYLQELKIDVEPIIGVKLDKKADITEFARESIDGPEAKRAEIDAKLSEAVRDKWTEIEDKVKIKATKYNIK